MKKTWIFLVPALAWCAVAAYGENGGPEWGDSRPMAADVANQVTTNQNQNTSVSTGDASSDSTSTSNVNINTTSISDYKTRTPPLTTFPPYLPYWNHGGWGTIKAYFPNGPTANDQVYETTFNPQNPDDMREVRSVLKALPHNGVLAAVGGVLNGVGVALFGKPDTYFRGRGIEIADSIVRDRRPEGKSLLVFIDSNVDMKLLGEEGYAYMGKVSVEADPDRNWDQGYKAAVAEALLWDVDILLISGGMKGVTTGTNTTFPSAGAGYSQVNYSLSLMGAKAKGITEGKGKAILSAEAYRYYPERVERRRIPAAIYDRIRCRPWPAATSGPVSTPAQVQLPVPRGTESLAPARTEVTESVGESAKPSAASSAPAPAPAQTSSAVPAGAPARRLEPKRPPYDGPGITMSRELFDMAGFPNDQQVGYVHIQP